MVSVLMFSLIVAFTCGVIGPSVWAAPVNVKAVAFLPSNNANVAGFNLFMEKMLLQSLNGENRISFYRGSFKKRSLLREGSTIRSDSKFFQKKPGQRIAGFRKR